MHPAIAAAILNALSKARARLARARSAFDLNYDRMGYEERHEQGNIIAQSSRQVYRLALLATLSR